MEYISNEYQPLICHYQGRSQEFATGDKRGGLGTEVSQRGPGPEPRWGSGGETETNANFQLRRGDVQPCPPWLRHWSLC